MTTQKGSEHFDTEEKNDVLASTQTIIREALDKLGYSEDVYELLKEPLLYCQEYLYSLSQNKLQCQIPLAF